MFDKKLQITIKHNHDQLEVKKRISGLASSLRTLHSDKLQDIQESWDDFNATFYLVGTGLKMTLFLNITSAEVNLDGNLPILIRLHKKEIEHSFREQLTEMLQ